MFQLGVILAEWLAALVCVWVLWRLCVLSWRGLARFAAWTRRTGFTRMITGSVIMLVACALIAGVIIVGRDLWYNVTCARLQHEYHIHFCGQLLVSG